jgi:hypothetical protein
MSEIVLVIGAQRSGTTLLGRLLAEHQDVFLTVNGKLLYYLITWIYRDPSDFPGRHLRLDEIAFGLRRKPILGVEPACAEEMAELLLRDFGPGRFYDAEPREIVATIWKEVYSKLARNKSIIGDKYNEYLLQFREIMELFPDARYIFIHRHPFEVAESMCRAFRGRPWAPDSTLTAIRKWTDWNIQWQHARQRIHHHRRFEVGYEILVKEPEQVFKQVCAFLGITCTEGYLSLVRAEVRQDRLGARDGIAPDWDEVCRSIPNFVEVCGKFGYGADLEKTPLEL